MLFRDLINHGFDLVGLRMGRVSKAMADKLCASGINSNSKSQDYEAREERVQWFLGGMIVAIAVWRVEAVLGINQWMGIFT